MYIESPRLLATKLPKRFVLFCPDLPSSLYPYRRLPALSNRLGISPVAAPGAPTAGRNPLSRAPYTVARKPARVLLLEPATRADCRFSNPHRTAAVRCGGLLRVAVRVEIPKLHDENHHIVRICHIQAA